ncbi:MAG TPA: CAP domain-containing protein [Gaiellaceae bacterium]|nr:CAP domain-containing protein [Gaiellaceae bacterium]
MTARISKLAFALSILSAVTAICLAIPGTAQPAQAQTSTSELATLDHGVLQQLNAIRKLHDLTPLTLDASLSRSASQHTVEMGLKGYFEHNSADGTAFWKRIERFYPSSSFGYWSVGENLLWSSPDVDPAQAMQMWMNSPEHRANILNPRWRQIGVSSVHFDTAPGTYQNLAVTIITTDFGVRR